MARYNTSLASATITGSTVISTPNSGAFTALTGTAPYTVTLPSPSFFPGTNQTFYNATSGTVTLSTPSGSFNGTGGSSASTLSVYAGNVVSVTSDNTNYVVISEDGSAMTATTGNFSGNLTVAGVLTVQSSGGVSMAPSSAGSIDNVTIGSSSRSSGAFTSLASNGQVTFTAGTASSTTGTGTLVVTGGLGVSGNINSGGNISATNVTANLTGTLQTAAQPNITSTGSLTTTGLTVTEKIIAGNSTSSTSGTSIIEGRYSNGALTVFGSEYSSGGPFVGYGVRPSTSATDAFISSSSIAGLQRAAYVQSGATHKWYTATGTTVAEGSSVSLAQRLTLTQNGSLGIGTANPNAQLHVFNRVDGNGAPYTPEIRIEHQDINAVGTQGTDGGVLSFYNIQRDNTGWNEGKRWGQIDFYPSQPTAGTAQIGARIFAAADGTGNGAIGGTNTASYISFSTTSQTTLTQRLKIDSAGRFLFNTTDFSYTQHDNTQITGGKTNNAVFVNGSVQLLSNDDAFVIGRGTSSFFKDEEIGFGWGSGWYMQDVTYLRMRNPSGKVLYLANAPVHTPKIQNNAGNMYFFSGSKSAAATAFDMFQIDGLGGSNGFFSIEIYFSHSGGGMHGAWTRYKVSINAYSDQQIIENVAVPWGGTGAYSFTRNTNDRMTVRWLGTTGFSSSYSMYAFIITNRGITLTNLGMDGFDAG